MTDEASPPQEEKPEPRWQPLPPIDRRVAGVLVEKAKTTPQAYPMSLNAIASAANQKSNRSPVMNLEPDDIEESLERLRLLGAVGLIEGYGRVSKYRHYLYDWLGVDKVEIAVMAELLLRGDQTIGELRARAARMEPIADLGELRPVVAALKAKGLVIPLTPEGRGHVVTHALYLPEELESLKARYGGGQSASATLSPTSFDQSAAAGQPQTAPPPIEAPVAHTAGVDPEMAQALRRELEELRSQMAQLRSDFEDLTTAVEQTSDDVQRLRDALGG
jgi:uncharacterized protein YceH (UPF0502 family)